MSGEKPGPSPSGRIINTTRPLAPDGVSILPVFPGMLAEQKTMTYIKVLPDQNVIRYYTKFKPAQKAGRVAGARIVTEVDVSNGAVRRVWQELYDHAGNVIEVHPKFPIDLGHIPRIP